eukprot:TRINITY_DN62287_c0_g1_i2.p1 TRINITY_DN62287_c0_g1~~TRINITY_DN62287_c0_g1_i2.p1  ORF type:complete len:348 (+),score=166.84 TRINITY_DN62287_c0_g1_i2:172-1215(+)
MNKMVALLFSNKFWASNRGRVVLYTAATALMFMSLSLQFGGLGDIFGSTRAPIKCPNNDMPVTAITNGYFKQMIQHTGKPLGDRDSPAFRNRFQYDPVTLAQASKDLKDKFLRWADHVTTPGSLWVDNTPFTSKDICHAPMATCLGSFEPTFVCPSLERIGNIGDGGKWMCGARYLKQEKECLLYAFGHNGEISFEEELYGLSGCEIHIFDIVDYSEQTPAHMYFHHLGIDSFSFESKVAAFRSLSEIKQKLGHEDRHLHIIKLDAEGVEFDVLDCELKRWIDEDEFPDQILVEFHFDNQPAGTFVRLVELIRKFIQVGYGIAHKELMYIRTIGELSLVLLPPEMRQ